MLRMFKKLEHKGEGSYVNEVATMKVVVDDKAKERMIKLIKKLTGRTPDLEIEFKAEKLLGIVWYK